VSSAVRPARSPQPGHRRATQYISLARANDAAAAVGEGASATATCEPAPLATRVRRRTGGNVSSTVVLVPRGIILARERGRRGASRSHQSLWPRHRGGRRTRRQSLSLVGLAVLPIQVVDGHSAHRRLSGE
jgi:hypothetical protein